MAVTARSAAEAQLAEAVEGRVQAVRTHRATRAASIAGVLAGPLAIYVAARESVPNDEAVTVGAVWVVAPTLAWWLPVRWRRKQKPRPSED